MLYSIQLVEETLTHHLSSIRNVGAVELLLHNALNGADAGDFLRRHDAHTDAALTGTCGTATPVRVHFRIIWQLIINYVRQVGNVHTSCSYIRSHNGLYGPRLKAFHHLAAHL